MDISLFKAFRAKLALGRRRDAAVSLGVFVRSLDTLAKKRQFTEWLLAQRDGRRDGERHELGPTSCSRFLGRLRQRRCRQHVSVGT